MSTATTGITNLYLYLNYVNDVNDDPAADPSAIETLKFTIDQVNDLIGKKCARNFGSATYKEWVDTKGESFVVLNNYPITRVKLVSRSSTDLMSIEGTGFTLATTSSNGSSVVLSSVATDGETDTDNVLNYATYANVNSLSTAVNLLSGWEAEVLGDNGNAMTSLIRPVESDWALDEKAYLSGPQMGGKARISYDSDAILDLGSEFRSKFRSEFRSEFRSDGGTVFVWYVAGYTLPVCDASGGTLTTVGNVPEGLTFVANEIIKDFYESKDEDRNFKEESEGDWKAARDGLSSAIDRHWSDLNQYARKSV